jgi:hypothetical protein
MSKLPIIIWTPRWTANCGGIMVLHKLCHMLRERGKEAYIWIDSGNIGGAVSLIYDTPIANGKIDPKNSVLVYPEGVVGNPLSAKVVVRWVLYFPGTWGAKMEPAPSDIVLHYAPRFVANPNKENLLCIFELNYDLFNGVSSDQRQGGCFVNRKGANKPRIPETDGCLEIISSSLEYTIPIFRSKEVFYSYDTATVISLHAAMCGCLSVVIPDTGLTAEEYRKQMPMFKYGVAYGTSTEEIEYAKSTQHLVKGHLQNIEKEGYNHIKNLLNILEQLRVRDE